MKRKQNVRIGLLGYGSWGQWHARIIDKTAGASLVAVADAREERRKKAQSDFPITAYRDYEDLIDLEDVDLIDVTLPNFLHLDAALKAIEADKHVMLEKPMGLSEQECDTVLQVRRQAIKSKGGRKGNAPILAIGFELRMSSLWRKVKELIDEGVIGTPRSAQMDVFRDLPDLGKGAWRLDRSKAGSWMLDGPIHYFDLLRWYFSNAGDAISIYSAASSRKTDSFDNSFSSVLRFSEGSFASLYYCMGGFGHSITLKISGDAGGITASWEATEGTSSDPTYRLKVGQGKRISEVELERNPGEIFDLEAEILELVQSVKEGSLPKLASGEDGKEAVRLCLAAEKSLQSGERAEV
jgi:myo-inositol 2-dehydrogenase/D-chiro-inositol 1-dehydrogenase